jgi:hypothetical protein
VPLELDPQTTEQLHHNWQAAAAASAAAQLNKCNAKYIHTALQTKYLQETDKWQSLLEVEMDEANAL